MTNGGKDRFVLRNVTIIISWKRMYFKAIRMTNGGKDRFCVGKCNYNNYLEENVL